MAPESVKAAGTGAVGTVVTLPDQPWGAGSPVQADHILAARQCHGAVLPAEAGLTVADIVGDAV